MVACPKLNTEALLPYGLKLNGHRQNVIGAELLPIDYFNPYDWSNGKLKITKNTYSIHHYAASWQSAGEVKNNIERHNYEKIKKKYGKIPADIYSNYFWSKKENGGKGLVNVIINRIFH